MRWLPAAVDSPSKALSPEGSTSRVESTLTRHGPAFAATASFGAGKSATMANRQLELTAPDGIPTLVAEGICPPLSSMGPNSSIEWLTVIIALAEGRHKFR